MPQQAYIRAALATATLQMFPKRVRDALISDPQFRADHNMKADAIISFGRGDIEFQRSVLMGAVRRALRSRKKSPAVNDVSGQAWLVEFDRDKESLELTAVQGETRLAVGHFMLLSQNRALRLKVFRREANDLGLPHLDAKKWEEVLFAHPADDDELMAIQEDLNATPVAVENAVRGSLTTGNVSLNVFIPRSELYYERLVGKCDPGQTFEAFVSTGLTRHIRDLIAWDPLRGYRLALMLAAQPSISAVIGAETIPTQRHATMFEELAAQGDVLSRAAAIEMGFDQVRSTAELREPFARLIQAAVAAAPIAKIDPYKLLSSLIVLTYGEIAHTRVLAAKPPYWRRLAAIAQAAVIARCVATTGDDGTQFIKWALTVRSQLFLLQCFVDVREEPRWVAELVLPNQLRNELGGRIWTAANAHSAFVIEEGWKELLLDETAGSLRHQLNLPQIMLPGPLEGSSTLIMEIPPEHLGEIRTDLSRAVITAECFSALANAALFFRIPLDVVDLASDALSRAEYYLQRSGDQPLVPFLLGLATIAAVTRNQRLADTLFILLRKYRRLYPNELDVDAALRVALMACGSRADLRDWCKCVGDHVTDTAFQQLTRDEAVRLHSHVALLCHLVPELWGTCGQAEAALQSVLSI